MKQLLNVALCCVTLIIVVLIGGHIIREKSRANDVLTVTGLASHDFVSDIITWNGTFTRKNMDLKSAYAELEQDRHAVEEYLLSK